MVNDICRIQWTQRTAPSVLFCRACISASLCPVTWRATGWLDKVVMLLGFNFTFGESLCFVVGSAAFETVEQQRFCSTLGQDFGIRGSKCTARVGNGSVPRRISIEPVFRGMRVRVDEVLQYAQTCSIAVSNMSWAAVSVDWLCRFSASV